MTKILEDRSALRGGSYRDDSSVARSAFRTVEPADMSIAQLDEEEVAAAEGKSGPAASVEDLGLALSALSDDLRGKDGNRGANSMAVTELDRRGS